MVFFGVEWEGGRRMVIFWAILSGPVDSMARFATAEDVTAVLVVVLPRAAWPGLQAAASLLGACPSQEAVSAGVTSLGRGPLSRNASKVRICRLSSSSVECCWVSTLSMTSLLIGPAEGMAAFGAGADQASAAAAGVAVASKTM